MGQSSKIEWTQATWNPVTGCTRISPGCAHCYAESFARRLQGAGNKRYERGFAVTLHWDKLELPLRWKKPSFVFVDSMGDLFHERVPFRFIEGVFKTMVSSPKHTFQVLTKRAHRMAELSSRLPWPPNVWAGVSIENDSYLSRLQHLLAVPASIRFVSFEPLLAAIGSVDLEGIDWVIVGGESGPQARPMQASWVRQIRAECRAGRVPFFFKQWGGRNKTRAGRLLDGRIYDELPRQHLDG